MAVWPLVAMALQVRARAHSRPPLPAWRRGWRVCRRYRRRGLRLLWASPLPCVSLPCLQVANHFFQWLDVETLSFSVNAGKPRASGRPLPRRMCSLAVGACLCAACAGSPLCLLPYSLRACHAGQGCPAGTRRPAALCSLLTRSRAANPGTQCWPRGLAFRRRPAPILPWFDSTSLAAPLPHPTLYPSLHATPRPPSPPPTHTSALPTPTPTPPALPRSGDCRLPALRGVRHQRDLRLPQHPLPHHPQGGRLRGARPPAARCVLPAGRGHLRCVRRCWHAGWCPLLLPSQA